MTEKRFEWQNQEYHVNKIFDNKNGKAVFDEDLVDLLNTLHEENEKCKEYNAILYSNTTKDIKELLKENEQLKQENDRLHQKIFEMRTNIALERTEISRQTYTAKKNEKEYLNAKEFLDEMEKW